MWLVKLGLNVQLVLLLIVLATVVLWDAVDADSCGTLQRTSCACADHRATGRG